MKPRRTVNYRSLRTDRQMALQRKAEQKRERRLARAAEERHLGHVSDLDPTAGMPECDLPEKLIAADYTSPPKLLAPGEVR